MPAIITTTGNIISNHSVVIWKMILGTIKIIASGIVVMLAGTNWGDESGTQHIIVICGGIGLIATNIESLLTNTSQPQDSSDTISGMPPTNPAPKVPTVSVPQAVNKI